MLLGKFLLAFSVTILWLTIEGVQGSAYLDPLPITAGLRQARNILIGGPQGFPERNARDMAQNWPSIPEEAKTNPPPEDIEMGRPKPGAFNPVWGWADDRGWTSLGWIAVQSTCSLTGWSNTPTTGWSGSSTTTVTEVTTFTDTSTSIATETTTLTSTTIIPTTTTAVISSTTVITNTVTQTVSMGWGWEGATSSDLTEIITILPSSDIHIETSTHFETIIVTATPTFVAQETLTIQCSVETADTTITLPFSITPDFLTNTVYESSTSTEIVDTKYVSINGWGSVATQYICSETTTLPTTLTAVCTTAAGNSKDCKGGRFGWCSSATTPSCPTTTCFKTVTKVVTGPSSIVTYTGDIIQTAISITSTATSTTTSTIPVTDMSTSTSTITNTVHSISPVSETTTITTSNPVIISQSGSCVDTTYTDTSSFVHVGTLTDGSTATLTSTQIKCVTPTITITSTEFTSNPPSIPTTTSTVLVGFVQSTSTITTIIPIHPSSTTTVATVSTKYSGTTTITPHVTKTITATSTIVSTPISTIVDIGTHALTKNTKITTVAESDTLLTILTPTVVEIITATINPSVTPTLTTTILQITQSVSCPGWSGWAAEEKKWWH